MQRDERRPGPGRTDDGVPGLSRRARRQHLVSPGARQQARRLRPRRRRSRHQRAVQQCARDDLQLPEPLVLRTRRQPARRADRFLRGRAPRDRPRSRLPHLRRRDHRPAPPQSQRHLHAEPRGPQHRAVRVVRDDGRAARGVREGHREPPLDGRRRGREQRRPHGRRPRSKRTRADVRAQSRRERLVGLALRHGVLAE